MTLGGFYYKLFGEYTMLRLSKHLPLQILMVFLCQLTVYGQTDTAQKTVHEKVTTIRETTTTVSEVKKTEDKSRVVAIFIKNRSGNAFKDITLEDKYQKMRQHLSDFEHLTNMKSHDILIVKHKEQIVFDKSSFCVENRSYVKRDTETEQKFMSFLLPDKAKFIPLGI